VRRPFLVIAGALLLQLSLLSIAQAQTNNSTPDSSETSSTVEPTSTTEDETTTTKEQTTTTEEETTTTEGEPEPPEFGTMSIAPTSGRPGTVIRINSITPSPLDGDQFTLVGLFKVNTNTPIVVNRLDVAADGSWSGRLVVPNVRPGDYFVAAETFLEGSDESFPYAGLGFEVTAAPIRPGVRPPSAPSRPAAPPVVRVPSLTG
jgi:hypothetical protein